MDKAQQENGTQAIQRSLAVLNCFSREKEDLSLTEISKLVQIPYSTAARITSILEKESFLIRDKHTKRFSLGLRVYILGYFAKENDFLRKIVHPYLVKLRDEFGETALIYIREGNSRICYEKIPAFHNFKFSPTVGSKYVLWAGAGGRAFLAYAAPEEQEELIKSAIQLTSFTTVDKKELMAELYDMCRTGYIYCVNQYQDGFSSIAGPVIDSNNNVLCTIAVTGPTARFHEETVSGLKKRIPEYCIEISQAIGWKRDFSCPDIIFRSPSLENIIANMAGDNYIR